MELNEESKSAIAEIGNLCIAGGSNQIANFSDTLLDISVVESEIRDTQELLIEINPYDDCKLLMGLPVKGEIEGKFLVQVPVEAMEILINRFKGLKSNVEGAEPNDVMLELSTEFFNGCIEGISGMTGIDISPELERAQFYDDLDTTQFPEQVLCYNSMIYIGDERLDFNVYFFADPQKVIPCVLESLGLA